MATHMSPEEFRRHGHAIVDWLADYLASVPDRPVVPAVRPGDVAALLPAGPPEDGDGFDSLLADLDRIVLPGMLHWQHPSFFGYFPANTTGPAMLGDLVAAGLGVQGMLWSTGPACTEVETVLLDWLAQLLDLPAAFRSASGGGGVIQDSASSATLVATLAALHRATGGRWRESGVDGRLRVYTSVDGHSSIAKAARIAGLGDAAVRVLPVDPVSHGLSARALGEAMRADRAAGDIPALVVATMGTTSTSAIDPLAEIGPLCRQFGVWLHVDAAYAGAAAVCPEFRWMLAGLEHADSFCFDPHKWLLTTFDCDAFWVASRAELIGALSILPEYLRNAATEAGAVIDYRDWQVPLGRRFRALKLWFVLRWYGASGVREHIRTGVRLAQHFADLVRADDRFEIAAPHPLSLVCFRLCDHSDGIDGSDRFDGSGGVQLTTDERNIELLRRVNASGRAYLSHTRVDGRHTLRLAIGAPATGREHVDDAWDLIRAEASEVLKL